MSAARSPGELVIAVASICGYPLFHLAKNMLSVIYFPNTNGRSFFALPFHGDG